MSGYLESVARGACSLLINIDYDSDLPGGGIGLYALVS